MTEDAAVDAKALKQSKQIVHAHGVNYEVSVDRNEPDAILVRWKRGAEGEKLRKGIAWKNDSENKPVFYDVDPKKAEGWIKFRKGEIEFNANATGEPVTYTLKKLGSQLQITVKNTVTRLGVEHEAGEHIADTSEFIHSVITPNVKAITMATDLAYNTSQDQLARDLERNFARKETSIV